MSLKDLTFALIDDDKTMLKILGALFEEGDLTYSPFHSASTAIIDIIEEQPDCVITDINMAGMDGLSLIKELRKNDIMANTKYIVITANQGDEWKEKAKEAGAHGFILKPFDTDNLLKQVEAICLG
ncbi:putative Chemotaxis regulator protein [Candidatus Terasakiella magnetica]|uniref:Putative Chemotaxis regulator protein n=1 Tax=Candidatus Terasakiella magnetica TaxID=1867952 RepID=A0A1C3RDC5_9PROT|nr:response regulator [Candidatus Terasakiella magnetica]SCA55248.1 putative Chemotaxis regulator protein [Candidatus Terasakiella magnetica]